jgi:TDG/mug DNA glycosylase family protein
VALNGKRVGREVARVLGRPPPALGLQPWTAYDARFFVLPSSSGANRRRDYDGRPARVDWWSEMAELVRQG